MATRYWVTTGTTVGIGNWSNTQNWSATSGGAAGASAPGAADTAIFNSNSGFGPATVDSNVTIQTLTMTNSTINLNFGTNTISLNSTGNVFTANNTHSVSGTPVIIVTSTGATAIGVTPGTSVTEANSISFKFTGGTYVLSFLIFAGSTAKNVDFTGFAGTWTSAGIAASTIYGSLTLSTGMTITASTNALTFGATSGVQTVTTNGKTVPFPLNINGSNGTVQLADAMVIASANVLTHTNGTLNLNGKTLTVGTAAGAYTTAAGTKVLTFNGGTLVCPGTNTTAFNNAAPTGFSTIAGTGSGRINMSGATAKTFVGGGSTFNCALWNTGAGALTISGNNAIDTVTSSSGALSITGNNTITTLTNNTQPVTYTFTTGTTTTITNFNVGGISGSLVTLTGAGAYTLSKASGNALGQYMSLTNANATGGASWYAANSTNVSGNTGWTFGANRYWVGGTGNWSTAARWAATSGGAGGSGITPADAAIFDTASGGGIATVDSNVIVTSLTMTGYTGTLDFGTNTISLYNDGTPYTGATTYSVSGTPVINIIYAGANSLTVSTGNSTEANSISFNHTAGTYDLTFSGRSRNLNFTGFSGSLTTGTIIIYGDFTLSSTMTVASVSNSTTFSSTSATPRVITSNGVTIGRNLTFNGVSGGVNYGTWQLADNLTVGAGRGVFHSNGTLDLNGKVLSIIASNVVDSYATAAGTKVLTFNGGTMIVYSTTPTAFNNAVPTGFSTVAGTGVGKISMAGVGTKSFVGGGATYNCTLSNDSAGALTISGNNTFTTITNTVRPTTFSLTGGNTQTVTNWNVGGLAGNLVTIDRAGTGTSTLSKASGTISSDYLNIQLNTATGGATWYAGANSIDSGFNSGWIFTGPPVAYSITALNGTYTLNGQSIGIARNRNLSGLYGSYSVSGQSVVVTRSRSLFGSYGSYSVSGQTAGIFRGRSLLGSYGSYNLTGQTAVITYTVISVNYTITANAGSYTLNGQSISIARNRSLTSNYGFYGVTGQTANLYRSRALNSGYGVYALTGSSADLVFGRTLTASPGDYAVTGQDATLTKSNLLSAENGLYSLTGQAVNITYSGAPVETVTQYWIEIRSFTESRRI
jgi:hypothetical protein